MGLYIHLSVNFRGITKDAWEAAWLESLDILKKFPLPLFRYDVETKKGKERHVYSRNLILDAETAEECWHLEGDLLSRQTAETFDLYRHLEAYTKESGQHACYDHSVFKTDEPAYSCSSNGLQIWDSKTQGFPYHLAVLAVGIMLENRFPENCYIYGDIKEQQVTEVLRWLETTYNEEYAKPICFDASRLYKKLHLVYAPDRQATIERFADLYHGEDRDLLKAMFSTVGEEETFAYWIAELNHYESLDQWGAQEILQAVLEATEDVELLIEFVEKANSLRSAAQRPFEMSYLLKKLCNDFIFVPPSEREYARILNQRSEDLQTIDDVLGQLFMKMAGMPYLSPLYIPADELFEIFALHYPKQGEEFKLIIEEGQKKLNKWLNELQQTIAQLEERLDNDPDLPEDEEPETSSIENYPLHEQYIVRQAIQQQEDYEIHNQYLPELEAALQGLIEKHPKLFEGKSVDAYLRGIYEFSFDAGWGLSAEGWQKLDQIKAVPQLKNLFALAIVDNHETTFWRWRKHIFEHVELFGGTNFSNAE